MDEELRIFLEQAFPEQPWDDDRVAAFKEAVYSCEGESEEEPMGPERKGAKAPGLAVIIGAEKKKK